MQRIAPHPPQGALRQPDGSVVWRVWAPSSTAVSLVTLSSAGAPGNRNDARGRRLFRPSAIAGGRRIAVCVQAGRRPRLSRSGVALATRRRPSSLGRVLSRIVRLVGRGMARHRPRRTGRSTNCTSARSRRRARFEAIIPRLPQLLSLGVTAVELMPVAQFAGDRNWGYDAVYPYAVQNSYGGPRRCNGSLTPPIRPGWR